VSYFTTAEHDALIADPNYIITLYSNNRTRFTASLGPRFAAEIEEHIRLAFCGVVAYDLKPYGASTPSTLEGLLSANVLQCSGYAILTYRLFLLLVPAPTTTVAFVGWNGGTVANHCQIFARKAPDATGSNGGDLLVDATIGLVLCGHSFDWIASSGKCNMLYAKNFNWRTDISTFNTAVVAALTNGTYKPSTLLYWFTDFEKFIAPPPQSNWATPQS
jgi:hypothetical protein